MLFRRKVILKIVLKTAGIRNITPCTYDSTNLLARGCGLLFQQKIKGNGQFRSVERGKLLAALREYKIFLK